MSERSDPSIQNALEELRAHHRGILEQIRTEQRRALDIARSAWRAQEDERGRLARELHDGLGQYLTALKNELTRLTDVAGPIEPDRLAGALALCTSCLEDTRSIARNLRPAVLDDFGLDSAIRQLCRTTEQEGIAIEFLPKGAVDELSRELGTLVYRVIQEAVTNIVKHAGASVAIIRLTVDERRVTLIVMDDGAGFDMSDRDLASEGFGLRAMRERAALFAGKLVIESEPGEGTRVRAVLPRRGRDA